MVKTDLQSKLQGELAELIFQLEAVKRGFIVSIPHGDSSKYDLVIDYNGRLSRIQVKSTNILDTQNRQNRYRILAVNGCKAKNIYSCRDVDFIAAYVIPCDSWYFIPIKELNGSMCIYLRPHKDKKADKYRKYLDKWDVFT